MSIELPPGTADYNDRSPPPKNRQLVLLLSFFLGLLLAIFGSINVAMNVLIAIVPSGVEQQLGALIVPAFEKLAPPSAAQDTLNQLLDRLETHLPTTQPNRNYQLLFIPDSTVNAMAIPGDRIILYKGLLEQVKSENELMMVLGHELGHFAHRDHLRQLGRGILLQMVLSGVLGDLGSLPSIALSASTQVSNARFSQTQEYRADEFGLSLLQKTYGHVAGATDFFARLSQQDLPTDFLATHPNSAKRVHQIESLIRDRGYAGGERSALPATLQK